VHLAGGSDLIFSLSSGEVPLEKERDAGSDLLSFCLRQRGYEYYLGTKPLLLRANTQEHECFEGGPTTQGDDRLAVHTRSRLVFSGSAGGRRVAPTTAVITWRSFHVAQRMLSVCVDGVGSVGVPERECSCHASLDSGQVGLCSDFIPRAGQSLQPSLLCALQGPRTCGRSEPHTLCHDGA